MSKGDKVNLFWFRRDLRLEDNTGLKAALSSGLPVLPLFIFDTNITDDLSFHDARINFIYDTLLTINHDLLKSGSSMLVVKGDPVLIFGKLKRQYSIDSVFCNKDYEPYAIERDEAVSKILKNSGIQFRSYKDQVMFEEREIVKPDGEPYTVFTPYRNRWMREFNIKREFLSSKGNDNFFLKADFVFPELKELGFGESTIKVKSFFLSHIHDYHKYRDIPAEDRTTHLGPHLRFGTVSIRQISEIAAMESQVFLDELIWREFFMQLLFNFPHVVTENFRTKYNGIQWRNNEEEFTRWCNGETGYPMVDAGMRQMNQTGFMHNRVRMIAASFLCKHLLTDWRRGEAYFAEKLNDYELSSNNGNWQWTAGTGVDAAQYFRIFNPSTQQKKFDPFDIYVKRWIDNYGKRSYPKPIVDHDLARERVFSAYGSGSRS
jgi:deoxyribodipyrimidine photo-lyase